MPTSLVIATQTIVIDADHVKIHGSPMILTINPVLGDNSLILPLNNYMNVIIDWGDDTTPYVSEPGVLKYVADIPSHDYATPADGTQVSIYIYDVPSCLATYQYESRGCVPHFGNINSYTGSDIIIGVQFGKLRTESFAYAFNTATELIDVTGKPEKTVTDMTGLFYGCSSFVGDTSSLSKWNTSNVLDMNNMFNGCTLFNASLKKWDVSSVQNMNKMFYVCSSFVGDLKRWDTSSVTDMSFMFLGCVRFNCDISAWNTSNVTTMSNMFNSCSAFNSKIDGWDVSNVINMDTMISYCLVFNRPLDGWDVSNVINMGHMFAGCPLFNRDLSSWDVSNVEDMSYMFQQAIAYDHDISMWDISKVADFTLFMDQVPFKTKYYDRLLKAWSQLLLRRDLSFDMPLVQYKPKYEKYRDYIILHFGWIITDAGPAM
jgi:surface protein